MTASAPPNPPASSDRPITVLLVDDQAIVGEAVRRMLAGETDIKFHFCSDPTKAIEQANALSPTVILQDLVMPEIDGLTLVKFFRANAATREVPMIVLSSKEEPTVKAQAFAVGANDYLVKLPDKVELIARIRYHSKGYIAQLERNEAYRRLAESEKQLAEEVAQAANYVRSLLPPAPISMGGVQVDWRFVPSTQLGGDSFGYHWLDDDHFALYLLDVSGHGVGSSLMSVSAMNVISSQSLPNTDFRDPGQVLQGLSSAFAMEKHDNKFFTIWYGVYRKSKRQIAFAGGGHPAGLLFTGADAASAKLQPLESQGPLIGLMDLPYDTTVTDLGPYAKLYIYSDGAYEIQRHDGPMWTFDEFAQYMGTLPHEGASIDRLLVEARKMKGSETLADDFSVVLFGF